MKGENWLILVMVLLIALLMWAALGWTPPPCPRGERPTVEGVCVPDGSWQWE